MQDKENRHTPSTVYASSRLGLASPAFQTPVRPGPPSPIISREAAATHSVPACPDAHAHSTPSAGTALTHVTPSVAGSAQTHSTPTSAAASGDAVLALRAFIGDRGRARLGDPAHTTPAASFIHDPSADVAQLPSHEPAGEVSTLSIPGIRSRTTSQLPLIRRASCLRHHLQIEQQWQLYSTSVYVSMSVYVMCSM